MKRIPWHSLIFFLSVLTAILLGVVGFLLPPMGIIDQSVIQFATLLCVPMVISQIRPVLREARRFRLQHGDTTVELETDKE